MKNNEYRPPVELERIATIREEEKWSLEFKVMEWFGSALFDLRRWFKDPMGRMPYSKGLTFDAEELQALKDALNAIDIAEVAERHGVSHGTKEKP